MNQTGPLLATVRHHPESDGDSSPDPCAEKKSYGTRSWPNRTFWQPCLAQAPNRFICPSSQLKALSWWGCPTARLSSASTMSTGYKSTIRCSSWVYRGESIYMVMALLDWLLTTVESGMEYLIIFKGWSSLQQTSSFPLLCTPSQRHLVGWAVFFVAKSDSGASGDSRFIESSSASDLKKTYSNFYKSVWHLSTRESSCSSCHFKDLKALLGERAAFFIHLASKKAPNFHNLKPRLGFCKSLCIILIMLRKHAGWTASPFLPVFQSFPARLHSNLAAELQHLKRARG